MHCFDAEQHPLPHICAQYQGRQAQFAIDQPVQHADEPLDIGYVQSDRRLVEHVQGVRRLVAAPGHVVAHLGQFGDELDALGLARRSAWVTADPA